MFQDIAPHVYHNEFSTKPPQMEDGLLVFSAEGLLCRLEENRVMLPTFADLGAELGQCRHLFSIDEKTYYLHEGSPLAATEPWRYENTRKLRDCQSDAQLFALGVAESLWRWYRGNRFCGSCGSEMEHGTKERSQVCPRCGHTVYPKICPAVIVAVCDEDRILLTRYAGRAFTRHALIAGFAEIGESIEDTVRREVMEEVGLRVKNLRFYKSQPWVFTDCLLMGFYAELDGTDAVTLQEDELSEALWYHREQIPQDYSTISLTGEMIEKFRLG